MTPPQRQNDIPRWRDEAQSGSDDRSRARTRLWKRRHFSLRAVVVVIVLTSLLAPEAAAIIDAAL
jgi:hypothetical protein